MMMNMLTNMLINTLINTLINMLINILDNTLTNIYMCSGCVRDVFGTGSGRVRDVFGKCSGCCTPLYAVAHRCKRFNFVLSSVLTTSLYQVAQSQLHRSTARPKCHHRV